MYEMPKFFTTTMSEWSYHAIPTYSVRNCLENELTRNSSGNARPQSSHFAEPLWTNHGLKSVKSGISARDLVSTLKKKKAPAGNYLSNLPPKASLSRKQAQQQKTLH